MTTATVASVSFGDDRLPARFWAKVEINANGCWIWTAARHKAGYGAFADFTHHTVITHRHAYALMIGLIPDGMQLDHTCHTNDQACMGGPTCPHRGCVNPAHLEPVTNAENIRRGRAGAARIARAALVTHCPKDHEYTPENTITTKRGRSCRECNRVDARERGRRNRLAASALRLAS